MNTTSDTDHPARVDLRKVRVERAPGAASEDDWVAVEEPLEVRLGGESFVVTMRTPGHDLELAAGFLFTEGVVRSPADLLSIHKRHDPSDYDPDNVVDIELSQDALDRHEALDAARRELTSTAACGLCGKARIEAVYRRLPEIPPPSQRVDVELLRSLPTQMRAGQQAFERTGGLHAAALFDAEGTLLALREDVGRHNAVDKLVGWALRQGSSGTGGAGGLPWHDLILVTSARAGFEIVQKAMMAAVPTVVAVGAASSLAVDAALRGGLDLYTFVRESRSNRHVR